MKISSKRLLTDGKKALVERGSSSCAFREKQKRHRRASLLIIGGERDSEPLFARVFSCKRSDRSANVIRFAQRRESGGVHHRVFSGKNKRATDERCLFCFWRSGLNVKRLTFQLMGEPLSTTAAVVTNPPACTVAYATGITAVKFSRYVFPRTIATLTG